MKRWLLHPIEQITGLNGNLRVADFAADFPFTPQRVFWVTNVPAGTTRGFHAHKTGNQILVCLSGRLVAKFYDGRHTEEIELTNATPAVWMKEMVWGEQIFVEENTVLMVLASNSYDESDYIRSRSEFELLSQKR